VTPKRSWFTILIGFANSAFNAVMPWVVIALLAGAMLFDHEGKALQISGGAFAVGYSLASIAFSYARTLREGDPFREEVIFGGKKLVTATILFLFTALLKYAADDIPRYVDLLFAAVPGPVKPVNPFEVYGYNLIIRIMFAAFAFFIFVAGLISAQIGISVLAGIMRRGMKNHPNNRRFFAPTEDYNKHLDELEKPGADPSGNA
jgi:hypothetical protein